ncbi:MAG TPA: hypothetical protein PK431_04835 [Chitinophagales bacterium]|nr:hypothetical protein [Chitinophagales bacterium]
MKYLVSFSILLLFLSCKNENDKIKELQKENLRLKEIITKQNWQRTKFEDSILKEPSNDCGFYTINVINNSASDYINISEKYKTTISLIENKSDYIDTLLYSNPSAEKTNNPIFANKIVYNYDYSCFDLKLNSKITGWNYFYEKLLL